MIYVIFILELFNREKLFIMPTVYFILFLFL